ncbi:MAG TPA: Crp/Fnr family transcriptional regulator [Thermoanaerobaculia bacterium]|nr:Crp/Fnr family transcriptional regulator [Thermoanaerobaculia bacterium]
MMSCLLPKPLLLQNDELRDTFMASRGSKRIALRPRQNICLGGDAARTLYFLASGTIKITTQSAAGRECLLRLQIAGDIFGQLSLLGAGDRMETATAREECEVWRLEAGEFVRELHRQDLCEEFMVHLVRLVREQEMRLADLVTEPSRHRLGKMLLLLGQRIGTRTSEGIRIDLRILHDEWAGMIGTTRPRVSTFFADFKRLRLICVTRERHLILHEDRLLRYLGEV